MSHDLDHDITGLRRLILTMGASAEQRVRQAFDAMLNRNSAQAKKVRASDDEIDDMEVDIEAECLRVLAVQHPMAIDLRFVVAAVRVNSGLERIADLARGVSKRTIDMADDDVAYPSQLMLMTNHAQSMLGKALKSLADNNSELAEDVRRDDEFVDEHLKEVFRWAEDELARREGEAARPIIDILFAARAIERIADISTNIAEDVIFIVGGDVVRHTPVE